MKTAFVSSLLALCVGTLVCACGAEKESEAAGDAELGTTWEAVSSCVGDDLQYDFNAFAASFAVAIGTELGRWDVMSDFVLSNGRLAFSSTGQTLCASGCPNVSAILALQDDASAGVPNHSPAVFRSKLIEWYNAERNALLELAASNLLAPGSYRIISRGNGNRLAVASTATTSGSTVGTFTSSPAPGADEWRAQVSGDRHKFVNVKTGLCLDLASDSSADFTLLQQKTCSVVSSTQRFQIEILDNGFAAINSKYGKSVTLRDNQPQSGNPTIQRTYSQYDPYLHWKIQTASGSGAVADLVSNGMYTLRSRHNSSSRMLAVENASTSDNALVKQYAYSEQDKFHWYVSRVGGAHQFINRRSGKCLALLTDSPSASAMGQKRCADVSTQKFTLERRGGMGERFFNVKGPYNKYLEMKNALQGDGVELILTAGDPQNYHRTFYFATIMAGEPHRLSYSHETPDAPCGVYKWYTITQPNGLPLTAPANAYAQLIFAGGKTTPNGADVNPFIAQQTTGTLIAIDPSGFLNGGSLGNTGSCIAADLFFDTSGLALGTCCLRYNGALGLFKRSAWSSTTFLCQ